MPESTMPDAHQDLDPRAISDEFAGEAEADNPAEDDQ
jgi:hypothetical protein